MFQVITLGGKCIKKSNKQISLLLKASFSFLFCRHETYGKAITGIDWACFSDKIQTPSGLNICWNLLKRGSITPNELIYSQTVPGKLHLIVLWKTHPRPFLFLQELLGETFMFKHYIAQQICMFPPISIALKSASCSASSSWTAAYVFLHASTSSHSGSWFKSFTVSFCGH